MIRCMAKTMIGGLARAGMLATCILLLAAPTSAQQGPTDPRAALEIEGLIEILEDDAARARLLESLRALATDNVAVGDSSQTEGLGKRILDGLSQRIGTVSASFAGAGEAVLRLPQFATKLRLQLANPDIRILWIAGLSKLFLVLVAGFAAEWLLLRALARPRVALEERSGSDWMARLPFLLVRTLLELIPVAAFALAANVMLPLTEPAPVTRVVTLALVNANVMARGLLVVARMILAPRAEGLRLAPLAGETAAYAYAWVRRFVYVGVYGAMLIAVGAALGLSDGGAAGLSKLLGLTLAGMGVVLVLQLRQQIASWIAPDGEATGLAVLRARVAETWHVLAILYLLAVLAVWLLEVHDGFTILVRGTVVTLVLIAVGQMASVAFGRGVERLFDLGEEMRRRFPLLEARANQYMPGLRIAGRVLIWFLVAAGALQAWGLDAAGLIASPSGVATLGSLVSIAVILIVAAIFLEAVSTAIERYLSQKGGTAAHSSRVRTLLPLARNILRVAVGVVVVLVILDELGLNIAPLLAGAGVIGLAVGFGAQTLVKDIITGAFILIEDTIAVGDVARVAGHSGVVESLTIRTIRLRDLSGTVHVIPFSEVGSIENLTKDFSYAVIEVGVAYREDIDEVVEVLKQVGAELQADPKIGPNILEPIDVMGVDALDDSAVVIKARFKTLPIKQWSTRRAFNRLIKKAFDAKGIEIPFPHTTIYFGEDKQGQAPPVNVSHKQTDEA